MSSLRISQLCNNSLTIVWFVYTKPYKSRVSREIPSGIVPWRPGVRDDGTGYAINVWAMQNTSRGDFNLTQPRGPQYSSAIQSTLLTLHSLPFTDTAENANLLVIAHYAIFPTSFG